MSLVLWSLSTEMRFRVRSTHQARLSRRRSRSTAASVQRKHSSVAMLGSIMPAPLATPTTLALPARALRTLGKASVVMIARATGRMDEACRPAAREGSAERISATGSCQPMMPVEALKKSSPGAPITAPRPARSSSASSRPRGVQTFEILLFTSTPRVTLRARRSRPRRTGAPGKRLRVNTPAKLAVGSSRAISERFIASGSATARSRGKKRMGAVPQRKPSGSADRDSSAARYSFSEA